MSRDVIASIDCAALRHNYQQLRRLAGSASILAMIKSNAYGHGLVRVAQVLSDSVDELGVACLEEAVALRDAKINVPITVMSGFFDKVELAHFKSHALAAVVHDPEQIALVSLEGADLQSPIWLKLDTGMHRLGISVDRFANSVAVLQKKVPISLLRTMTHLASADTDAAFTALQVDRYLTAVDSSGFEKSVVNSAGLLRYPQYHFEWVRPGILLYGVSPLPDVHANDYGFLPVMTLSAKIIALKSVNKGESIGYGLVSECLRDSRIAVIAMGYGDGYPRHAQPGCPVLINGQYCPLIGRVSMDLMAVDVTDHPLVERGDRAVLWGRGLPVEIIARHADTIPYTLLCGLTTRVTYCEA